MGKDQCTYKAETGVVKCRYPSARMPPSDSTVMRCHTLARDLRQFGMEGSFVSRVLPGDLCDYVESKGFSVHRLIAEVDSKVDYWKWLGENWLTDAIKTKEIILNQAGEQSDIDNVNTDNRIIKK